jgi:outer membrane protein TolC
MRPLASTIILLVPWLASLARAGEADQDVPQVIGARARVTRDISRSRTLTLRECLKLAEQNYPKVHEARAKLDKKRAELFEAHTAPFSNFTMTSGVGLAPTVRGTPIYSPNSDVTLSTSMALAWQVAIDGTLPLWTFGKITNLWEAADANVSVGEHEIKKAKNEVALSVREAYYGVQLSRDALSLIQDATRRIDKYLESLEAKVKEGDGDDIELLKVKMYREELEARKSEVLRRQRMALAGLRFLVGSQDPVNVPDRPLHRVKHRLGPIAHYLEAARLFRPEVNMARAGVLARRAQVEMQKSEYFPDIGLALSYRWVRAQEVTDQRNPFAKDSGNSVGYGFALAMRWQLDFLPQTARVAKAQADLEEMRATERYALGGVAVEVENAFAEAEDAERRLDAYSRAASYAKQWLIKVQQGIDVGVMDDEDIVDPAKEWALKRFSQMSATFDYNMAVAKLSLATGWEAVTGDD